jgi:hypothetical protein
MELLRCELYAIERLWPGLRSVERECLKRYDVGTDLLACSDYRSLFLRTYRTGIMRVAYLLPYENYK